MIFLDSTRSPVMLIKFSKSVRILSNFSNLLEKIFKLFCEILTGISRDSDFSKNELSCDLNHRKIIKEKIRKAK